MQAGDGQIGDAVQHIGQPCFWIDVVETGRGDEREHDGSPVGATIGTSEVPVFSSAGHAAQGSFRRVVKGYGVAGAPR